jgi:hypothetical protein
VHPLNQPAPAPQPTPQHQIGRVDTHAEPASGTLDQDEALELLALGEVIMRKASYGRQLTVRTARATGASWSQIGAALGTSKQSAWETHLRWIEDQAEQHHRSGYEGVTEQDNATTRALTGDLDAKDMS